MTLTLSAAALLAIAGAGSVSRALLPVPLAPTEAWHRLFNNSTFDDVAGPTTTDPSGYVYVCYSSNQPLGPVAHLVKIGPAENVVWDKILPFPPSVSTFTPKALLVSPSVGGNRSINVFGELSGNGDPTLAVYYDRFDVNSGQEWSVGRGGFGSLASSQNAYYVGSGFDPAGNLYIGLDVTDASSHREFLCYKMSSNGSSVPGADSNLEPKQAFWSNTLGKWLVAGTDLAGGQPNSTRWATVDPLTGVEATTHYAAGSLDNTTGAYVNNLYSIQLFSDDAYAVVLNTASATSNSSPVTLGWTLGHYQAGGALNWTYPASGSAPGITTQIARDDTTGGIYTVGKLNPFDAQSFVDLINSGGSLSYAHTAQPVDTVFPTSGGFFSEWYSFSNNRVFLEHYDTATSTYNWGTGYIGSGSGTTSFGGFSAFQNFFYFTVNESNTGSGFDVLVDRFVTGVCFNSITAAASVHSGSVLPVTLHLNATATSKVIIGFNSNSPYLLMPNGTRSQNFDVAVGNSSVVVNMTAQTVPSNQVVTLLGIQNGIRRPIAVTVIP